MSSSSKAPATPYELAKLFNDLPRSPKTPSGKVDNFWTASVRKVMLEPPGLVLHLVNPDSRYVHIEELPAAIEDADKLAVPVALALMKAFAEGMMSPQAPVAPQDRRKPFGPWSMGMVEADQPLARLVERQLRGLGIDKENRKFRTTTSEETKIANEVWDAFFETLKNAVEA